MPTGTRYLPGDLVWFLTPPYETASWVAADEGVVVGHVALPDAAVDPTLAAAQRATGLPPERLAVIARLLVSPSVRRQELGAQLLGHATAHAWSRGQRLVLDVTQDSVAPIGCTRQQVGSGSMPYGWTSTTSHSTCGSTSAPSPMPDR